MASQCFRGWGRRRRGGLTEGRDQHLNRVISFKRKRENGIQLDKQSKYNDVEAVCDFYQSVGNSNIPAAFFFPRKLHLASPRHETVLILPA